MKKALFHKTLDNNKYQCELCPRMCTLLPGSHGKCYVRKALKDGIYLLTYGKISGLAVDPIEKKPLYHFYPGSKILSFGSIGCNLACKFCQNWHISNSTELEGQLENLTPHQIMQVAIDNNIPSIAFTYNEPIIAAEYIMDIAEICKEKKINTVAVSSGYISSIAREKFFKDIDAANIDLKSISEKFYKTLCSASLGPVLDTLIYLKNQTNIWLEITTLLIPGQNDSIKELDKLTSWIADNLGSRVPLHFSAFHPAFKMEDIPPTSNKSLIQAKGIAEKNGLKYIYIGNIITDNGRNTYCPACNSLVINRSKYTENLLSTCPNCATKIDGVF